MIGVIRQKTEENDQLCNKHNVSNLTLTEGIRSRHNLSPTFVFLSFSPPYYPGSLRIFSILAMAYGVRSLLYAGVLNSFG